MLYFSSGKRKFSNSNLYIFQFFNRLADSFPVLEEQEDYSNDALYALLLDYVGKKGCKNGYVLWPVRTAV